MMSKGFIVSSFAALAITLSGAVLADSAEQAKTEAMLKAESGLLSGDQGGNDPAEIKNPTPDAEKQAKTEAMLKAESGLLSGDQGGNDPAETKDPTPDAAAQAKTEKELKGEAKELQDGN